MRGGLNVLLTTPLSTASIVTGKWWALVPIVPRLAILPAVGVIVMAAAAPEYVSRPALFLDDPLDGRRPPHHGRLPDGLGARPRAVLTSLGLALATWLSARRLRAVALSVSLYVVATVGGCFLIERPHGMGRRPVRIQESRGRIDR